MALELPKLPYPENALDPYISGEQMSFHYGKHHEAYVSTLNRLVKDTPLASKSVEEIVRLTANEKDESKVQIFNNAAQHWNHSFFWQCMKPNGGGAPSGELAQRITRDFGSLDKFKEMFQAAGVSQFGSGWAWLVAEKNELKITKTPNAVNPIATGQKALLTCDVWEH
ncbi:MAG TPA: superoxide dismutase, partial [Polyangiaceae bacterium]|nr:superoxide dismutase [Polyangiaceae bacterium]